MNPIETYIHDRDEQAKKNLEDRDLHVFTSRFTEELVRTNYTKNFTWMGIPIIQYPTDLMVMQELIWKIRPTMIIETGVAFGGMTLFYAEMLKNTWDQTNSAPIKRVIGIDIEIRPHTHEAIEKSKFATLIKLIQRSSIDKRNAYYIRQRHWGGFHPWDRILVSLDSNHTHNHVLKELQLYAPLVSVGSYIVVFDTAIEFFGHLDKNQDRPWGKGNNPWTAVQSFMTSDMGKNFVVDREVEQRALITAAPGGWLRRVT